jgi:hypothetical protein
MGERERSDDLSRADQNVVRGAVRTLRLDPGPADTPAHYQFQQIQIAFEDVWQELFDDEIVAVAREAYREIVELGGSSEDVSRAADVIEGIRSESALVQKANTPPSAIVEVFAVTSEQWRVFDFG